jgi:hypothetical protein
MTGEMTLSISTGAMLVMLGAYHGINPGMGWLFAVALGMQERRRAAVCRALLPLGMGHALAVGAAVAIAVLAGAVIPIRHLRWPVAGVLLVLGVSRLFRHRHPRWVGMRVGNGGLTVWSFLMASAHGAGLMVAPIFLRMAAPNTQPSCHMVKTSAPAAAALASGLHAIGYLLVTAIIALLVFEKFGVGILRKAWFNVDFIWAVALIGTGALTLAVSV